MTNIEKQLQHARPRLKLVSPLAHWTVLVMAWFNILLGSAMLLVLDHRIFSSPLLIVNDVFTFQFWGILFLGLGLLKLWSLKINDWRLSRNTLLLGVAVKAAWMVALTFRSVIEPQTLFINLCWITIALLQMGAYVYFMPPAVSTNVQAGPANVK